jgi:hypothetical protein
MEEWIELFNGKVISLNRTSSEQPGDGAEGR